MHAKRTGTNNILIVDDEPKVALILGKALERHNRANRVTIAHSDQEDLQILAPSDVDVLVTNLRMPCISGLELIRWACTSSPRACSILITAYGSKEITSQAYNLNASRPITKPFDIQQFTMEVKEALLLAEADCALTNAPRRRAAQQNINQAAPQTLASTDQAGRAAQDLHRLARVFNAFAKRYTM